MSEMRPNSTDPTLEADLRSRLAAAPGLADVHAVVTDGMAILTGTVADAVDIKRVRMIADSVDGLVDVREELKVSGASAMDQDVFFDRVEGISTRIPATGAAAFPAEIDEAPNPTKLTDDQELAGLIHRGIDVYDSQGKKVGKVKEVRATDFLLGRFLAHSYYVPYFSCEMSADGLHLKIPAGEMKDQGWASPHTETP
jgi:hypothetical protein